MSKGMPKKVVVRETEYEGRAMWGVFADDEKVATAVFETKRRADALANVIERSLKRLRAMMLFLLVGEVYLRAYEVTKGTRFFVDSDETRYHRKGFGGGTPV